jgi:hypothetical protein
MLTSMTTDANGYYAFSELREGGIYTVTPKGQLKFTPPRRSFGDLRRNESADFFQSDATPPPTPTPTPTPTPPPTEKQECSQEDQRRALNTLRNFEPSWRRKIEGERARIIAENVAEGRGHTEATLGKIEFQYSFIEPCRAAVVTARYAWQVYVPGNATSPGKTNNVSKERRFACGMLLGIWGCR